MVQERKLAAILVMFGGIAVIVARVCHYVQRVQRYREAKRENSKLS
jgi:hypothetical protein